MIGPTMMRRIRRWHLYLGVAVTPMLLMFAGSGIWQVWRMHSPKKMAPESSPWILRLISTAHTGADLSSGVFHPSEDSVVVGITVVAGEQEPGTFVRVVSGGRRFTEFAQPIQARVRSTVFIEVYEFRNADRSDSTRVTDFTAALSLDIGTLNSNGVRLTTVAGVTGTIEIFRGEVRERISIETVPSSIDHLVLAPDNAAVSAGERVDFDVIGVDRFGNEFKVTGNIGWHVVPPELGEIHARTGMFTAGSASVEGYVIAVASKGLRFGDTAVSPQGSAKVTVAAVPSVPTLYPNYPNPFNGETEVSFHLAEDAEISLQVFNLTGHVVADLQKGFLKAGKHRVTWRSTGLSSGTYLIRLQTDRHVETRKALFLQ